MSKLAVNEKWDLGLRKLVPPFTARGRDVSLSAIATIQQGQGTDEYLAFGDLTFDSSGKIHLTYLQATGHGAGPDKTVRYRTSIDGGETWTEPVTIIITAAEADYYIGSCGITVTPTGRLLAFFAKQDTGTDMQKQYLIYSDDGGSTWNSNGADGNEILLIDDLTPWMRATSAAIVVNGALLFPQYGLNTNEYSRVLKSVDDGLTWTLLSNITDGTMDTVQNAGETELLLRSDNVILANMRSETSPGGNWMTYSLDGGVTWWPKPWLIGDTRSKNPMAESPSGTLVTVVRDDASWRTSYGVSRDGGKTWVYDFFSDSLLRNMYATIKWDNVRNRFVAVWWEETGENFVSPCDMYVRFITEV